MKLTVSVCDDCHFAVQLEQTHQSEHAAFCDALDRVAQLARPCDSRVATVGHRNLPFDRAKTVEVDTWCLLSVSTCFEWTVGLMPRSLSALCLVVEGSLW